MITSHRASALQSDCAPEAVDGVCLPPRGDKYQIPVVRPPRVINLCDRYIRGLVGSCGSCDSSTRSSVLHVEMGAGKGALGLSIATAFPGADVTMVERSSVRRKVTGFEYKELAPRKRGYS